VTAASRLVAQVAPSVASGLGLSILAAGPARVRPYSYCGRLCEHEMPETDLYKLVPSGTRGATIFYTFDDEHVYVHAIRRDW